MVKRGKKEDKINKNIEDLQERDMNIIKKTVLGIGKYFKENYRDRLFRKVVSLLVVACFVLNIANIPVYAKSERRAKDNKEKNEQIIKTGKTDTSEVGLVSSKEAMKSGSGEGVSTMNAIGNMSEEEVDSIIEIDEEAGVIKDKKKNNAVVAVYNAEKEQVLGYAGQSDIVYYQALVDRKKALEKGEGKESGVTRIKIIDEQEGEKEEVRAGKTAEEIADTKLEKESENIKGEKQEENNIEGIEEEQKAGIEAIEGYKEVVSEIAKQSGEKEEEVAKGLEEALAGKSEEEAEGVIGLLKSFFEQGGNIINCAVEALGEVLNIASKGVLGLQTLLLEISTGMFEKNNADLIKAGERQLMTSMETMRVIMEEYGQEAVGAASDIETFMEGLKAGESAIVWVNGDHYITVTKLENGNYTISDANVRNGESVEYSGEGLKAVLSGGKGEDVDGNEVGISYKGLGEDGKIRVLTASEGIKEQIKAGKAQEISKEEMKDIAGAKIEYETVTEMVEVEMSREETRYRKEARTETRSYTDSNGEKHTENRTYYVIVAYKVTVKYKVKKPVKKQVAKQVSDTKDSDKKKEEEAKKVKDFNDKEEQAYAERKANVQKELEAEAEKLSKMDEKSFNEAKNSNKNKVEIEQETSEEEIEKDIDNGKVISKEVVEISTDDKDLKRYIEALDKAGLKVTIDEENPDRGLIVTGDRIYGDIELSSLGSTKEIEEFAEAYKATEDTDFKFKETKNGIKLIDSNLPEELDELVKDEDIRNKLEENPNQLSKEDYQKLIDELGIDGVKQLLSLIDDENNREQIRYDFGKAITGEDYQSNYNDLLKESLEKGQYYVSAFFEIFDPNYNNVTYNREVQYFVENFSVGELKTIKDSISDKRMQSDFAYQCNMALFAESNKYYDKYAALLTKAVNEGEEVVSAFFEIFDSDYSTFLYSGEVNRIVENMSVDEVKTLINSIPDNAMGYKDGEFVNVKDDFINTCRENISSERYDTLFVEAIEEKDLDSFLEIYGFQTEKMSDTVFDNLELEEIKNAIDSIDDESFRNQVIADFGNSIGNEKYLSLLKDSLENNNYELFFEIFDPQCNRDIQLGYINLIVDNGNDYLDKIYNYVEKVNPDSCILKNIDNVSTEVLDYLKKHKKNEAINFYIENYMATLNLNMNELKEYEWFYKYTKNQGYSNGDVSFSNIMSKVVSEGNGKLLFQILADKNFKNNNERFNKGNKEDNKYQLAIETMEYINTYCEHYGIADTSVISNKDMSYMINVVSIAYQTYFIGRDFSSVIAIDKNTQVVSIVGDTGRNGKHIPFGMTDFTNVLDKIGHDKNKRFSFVYSQDADGEQLKQGFFNKLLDISKETPDTKIYINIETHGAEDSFWIGDWEGKRINITTEEFADVLIQMHENGVDLSNVCIGLNACNTYYSTTEIYNRLETAGIDSLPVISAEAGFETKLGFGFSNNLYNWFGIGEEHAVFYSKLNSSVADKNKGVSLEDLYNAQNKASTEATGLISENKKSNATLFIPLDKSYFKQLDDALYPVVSKYDDNTVSDTEKLEDTDESISENANSFYPSKKQTNEEYSNTVYPINVFAYSIFGKEQDEELNEKAAVWEEVIFRAVPSMVAAIYDKDGGQESFSAYQEAFVYAHALSKWISNDDNVREEMSFGELVDSTKKEMGKGTSVIAGIYEEAIDAAKGLTGEEAREVIIDATLKAIGLHQAYNSGMISKEELESGNYDAGVVETALDTLGIDRGVVENLVDQSLHILGYSDTEVESEYMDMNQAYDKTDNLFQSTIPEKTKTLSIQKTVSKIVVPEVFGTAGEYLTKTTDFALNMVTNDSLKNINESTNIDVSKQAKSLFKYLQNNNVNFSPATLQQCQQSIDFSNSSEVSEQVHQAFDLYNDTFNVEIDSDTQVIFMIGTDSNSDSACACSDINTIIVPVDNFDNVPSADYIFTKIAHEYTHILDYSKVQSGQMSMMEDEVRATENGVIADTTYGKNITMQTRYNGEQKINFVSAMELSGFYSIMDNKDEIVEQFRQISGNQNIEFEDIYYYDVVYGENNFDIASSSHLSSTEVGITLEYQGIKLLYVTDTGIDINGTYDNAEMGESVSHRIEKLNIVEDRYLIETTLGNYTNESFSREDVVDSFEQVVVSKAFLNSFGKEFGVDIDNLQYAYYDFPTDSSFSDSGDVVRFYIVDKETDNMYSVDVKKDMGIVQFFDVTKDEVLWEAKEGLSKSLEPKTSTATTTSPGQTQSMKMFVSVSMGEEIVSDYEYIHDLSITDLQQTVNNSNADVTVRYLAFLELKEKGETVVIPNDMKDAAKEYLASVMNGEESLITAEEKRYGQYETATDRLKASLAMVYDIMLDSYIEEFNIDDDTLDQIWSNIYNNTEIYTSQPGFANSNFSFQVEAMLPDIMAHEIMHNITDVYLGTDKNATKKGIGEFSSDVARIILCEQIGVELTQDLKDEYKEDAGYMKVGMTPIEEHHLARGVLGLLIETSVKLEMSIDWNVMMSAVSQCLQSDNFRDTMDSNDYSQTVATVLSQYVAISTGNPAPVIVSSKNETIEICNNILKMFNFAQF